MKDINFIHVLNGINAVFSAFQSHPFDYLYESDLRAELYSALRRELGANRFELSKQARGRFGLQQGQHTTSCVRTEYPTRQRFDVAIAGQDDARGLWMQPVKIGFEIKLWQLDGAGHSHVKDVEKLLLQHSKDPDGFRGFSFIFAHSEEAARRKLLGAGQGLLDARHGNRPIEESGVSIHLITPEDHYSLEVVGSNSDKNSIWKLSETD